MAYDETATDNSVIAHLKFVTLQLLRGLRDNAEAMNAQTAGSPVQAAVWHPYNKVTVDDANDGIFYDFSVDGAVASVETPDFEDGYEYAVLGDDLYTTVTGLAVLRVEFYRSVDAAYSTVRPAITQNVGNTAISFNMFTNTPRIPRVGGAVSGLFFDQFGGGQIADTASFGDTTVQKIDRLRLTWDSGNFNSGTMRLYRRRFIF